jgi:hypothetical protein
MASSKLTPAPPWLTPVSFLLPLALYLWTAARTVQGGDMGEFGLIGMVGGVPHPPGYPLYALLSRAISFLPIDPPFFRIAITSALCGAGAVAVIQRLAWRLTGDVVASLGTALAFAVSSIHWRLSGVPEVFALHALCVALAMLVAARLLDAPRESIGREALSLGLVLGLSSSNHHTTVLLAPLLVMVTVSAGQRFGQGTALKTIGQVFGAGLLGLTPYLLLILWGSMDRSRVWAWGDTSNMSGLLTHVLRAEYGTFSLAAKHTATAEIRTHYVLASLRQFPIQYAYLFFLAGLGGIVVALKRHRLLAAGLLAALFCAGILFPSMMNLPRTELNTEVTERFFLMPMVLFTPFVAWGLHALGDRVRIAPLAGAMTLVVILNGALSLPHVNWRRDTLTERYLAASISSLPQNAIILGRNDVLLPGMGWMARVAKVRPDVRFIDTNLLGLRWYYDRVKAETPQFPLPYIHAIREVSEIAQAAASVGPTYLFPWVVADARKGANVVPAGLLYRIGAPGEVVSVDQFEAFINRDLQLLGDATDLPVDAWSGRVHDAIAFPLADLLEAHQAAGHEARATALLELIGGIIVPDSPDNIDRPADELPVAATH